MWRRVAVFCMTLFVCLSGSAWAVMEQSTNNLSDLTDFVESVLIKQKHIPPEAILVVFDDDNTLLTTPKNCPTPEAITCQYFGGNAWYVWQRQLLKNNPSSPALVANTQQKLDQVESFIFDLMPMRPTQPDLPELIAHLNDLGVSLLIETARGPAKSGATWHQLIQNKLPFKRHSLGSPLASYSLSPNSCGFSSWEGRVVSVRNGILYTSGRDKGKMLSCLLKNKFHKQHYQAVVMADDDKKNLNHVRDSLASDYDLSLFEYTRMHAAVQAFLEGPKRKAYQAQATKLWERLRRVIMGTFPAIMF